MPTERPHIDATSAGILDLNAGEHLCLFYDDPAEQAPALVPFFKQGLDRGERVIYVADDSNTNDVRQWLESAGVDTKRAQDRGELCLWTREQWRQPGELDGEAQAAQVRRVARETQDSGFPGVRFGIEMTSSGDHQVDADRLLHWESTIDTLFDPRANARIICQYSTRRLSTEALQAALKSHPTAVIGDTVCLNPYYEAPVILRGGGSVDRSQWTVSRLKAHRDDEMKRDQSVREHAARAETARRLDQLQDLHRAVDETSDRLRIANAAKDDFLALISHELRTPLTMILGNAEVLQRRGETLPEADRTAALDDLRTEAERLASIVEHLLIVSRLGHGAEFESEPVLPARIVEPLISHYQGGLGREIRLAGDVTIAAWASRSSLFEVLENLIGNAHKYSAPGTPIDVDVRRKDGECLVSVCDRGIGLVGDEKDRVFEPFYRSPRVSDTQVRGMGIGLTVCQRLVAAHHGRIWAEQRDGGGSVFSFALPAVEMPD